MPPFVSFVVLCFNHSAFLRDCLESIFSQEGDIPFEIILVDDASTDNSANIAASYKDSRLHLIRHSVNQGHVASVTDGLRAAQGEYIARIDDDDRYRPIFLGTALEKLSTDRTIGMVYGDAAL